MSDWIKISDKNKPEDSENVLVCLNFGGEDSITSAHYDKDHNSFHTDDCTLRKDIITHWHKMIDSPNKKHSKEAPSILKIVPSDTLIGKEHAIMLKFINMIVVSNDEDFFVDIKMTAKTIINNLKSQK